MLAVLHTGLTAIAQHLDASYQSLASPTVRDRTGSTIATEENAIGHFGSHTGTYPDTLRRLVIAKEDHWFYYHPGVNPYRSIVALVGYLSGQPQGGASTITQQLAKTLLAHTTTRSFAHKAEELLAACALEYRYTKGEILTMYLNTAYLGARAQGFPEAAAYYFNKKVIDLSESEMLSLVAALGNPSARRPNTEANTAAATALAAAVDIAPPLPAAQESMPARESGSRFELASMGVCDSCTTTIDNDLTRRLRRILHQHIADGAGNRMTHGAIVVIKMPETELLAVVGSPDPFSGAPGYAINMAIEPRPVGSTMKPFIYEQGFEHGLRPYSKASDRELRLDIGNGSSLYPRNYDGTYRGTVLLDEALQNSLNVPTVEVLRYVTLPTFYAYLDHALALAPTQPWDHYAYGIALGGLELDLMTLTHAYTALAHDGKLSPLSVRRDTDGPDRYYRPRASTLTTPRSIGDPRYIALVNAILSDRAGAVDEFGASGSLYLSHGGYAVKTGTSRDYHDAWTVGYTPEFVVGVWVGNAENKPMRHVSGMAGAGAIWHDAMELLFTTPYYTGQQLTNDTLAKVPSARGFSWSLPGENVNDHAHLLAEQSLILSPHDGDTLLYTPGMSIPLRASRECTWSLEGTGTIRNGYFYPEGSGAYTVSATADDGTRDTVSIRVDEQ